MKNIRIVLSEKLSFSVVKCSVYFNRRVFVIWRGVGNGLEKKSGDFTFEMFP